MKLTKAIPKRFLEKEGIIKRELEFSKSEWKLINKLTREKRGVWAFMGAMFINPITERGRLDISFFDFGNMDNAQEVIDKLSSYLIK